MDIKHGDISTVQTSGELFYPRVLLTGAEDHDGDGQADPTMTCSDPIDCLQKCKRLERTARHGAGAPPTCALCGQICTSNIVTTIMDIRDAVYEDVFTIIRLVGKCFGTCYFNSLYTSQITPQFKRLTFLSFPLSFSPFLRPTGYRGMHVPVRFHPRAGVAPSVHVGGGPV